MYFRFIKYRWIFYGLSLVAVVGALVAIAVFGLKLGIEFTGGSSLEVAYQGEPPSLQEIQTALSDFNLGPVSLQRVGEQGIILKMMFIDEATHQQVLEKLRTLGKIEEGSESFEVIGPMIGQELKRKTNVVMVLSLFFILLYIALSFRKVSRPVHSWVYGVTGVLALFHDVLIPLGIFAVLGRFYGVQITIPIITAFLTIFGYSINDSVVIFDRVRENLLKARSAEFDLTVEQALNQTLSRSINTTFTTLLSLFAIFFLGGETLRYFSFALLWGIGLGAYSSVFLAAPLLTSYLRFKERKRNKVA